MPIMPPLYDLLVVTEEFAEADPQRAIQLGHRRMAERVREAIGGSWVPSGGISVAMLKCGNVGVVCLSQAVVKAVPLKLGPHAPGKN
ncbi:MAG: hypothetical protein JWO57_659 [Pseudonocardiales bacterium]|nr:hypothetical protein [Pseudonocardiales bacterium]